MVGDLVFQFAAEAFETRQFDPAVVETMIVLILKVDNPRAFKELRPVSLCNFIHKLISKLLVNRIRPFMHDLIRGTTDNAIILQEVVHSMKKTKRRAAMMASLPIFFFSLSATP